MTNKSKLNIFVDADSCPVKTEIIEVGNKYNIDIIFVSSYAHATENYVDTNSSWIYVDCHQEAADLYIVNNCKANDIVITQDIGLASLLLAKAVTVISPRAYIFDEATIDNSLHIRHINAKARRSGHYSKGPSSFTQKDRDVFYKKFESILSKKQELQG